jgi:nucleoside-diphosphate-sugar epimerase
MLRHLNAIPRPPDRTVVLGAGGFIGRALMRRISAAGAAALGLTRREIDLLSPDAADQLAAVLRSGDALVAVAARAPCKDVPMLIDNLVMTRAMIDALGRTPVAHVVNISSDAVYADEPLPLSESSPAAPASLHGAMHLAREIAFSSTVKAPFAILRPSLIYGADDPHNGYGPNRFRRLAHAGSEIVLFGEGEEQRDHVLIDDVAEVIWRVLERRSAGILNIATGEVHSFRDIADGVIAAAGCRVSIKGSLRAAPMPHNGYRPFDIAACRAAFPDFAFTSLAAGLAKAQHDMSEQP